MNLEYEDLEEGIALSKESFECIVSIFRNRKLFYDGKIKLYSTEEVERLLNICNSQVIKLAKKGELKVVTIINGQYHFNANDIEEILDVLHKTYSIDDVERFIRKRCKFPNIERYIIRPYIEKKFRYIKNPVDKYDIRLLKRDLDILINYINENYKERTKNDNFSEYFKKFGSPSSYKYIDKSSVDMYLDYKELRSYYINNYAVQKSKNASFRTVINHCILVCSNLNIPWFTNSELNNIYILKDDKEKYCEYYITANEIFNSEDYYLNTQVQEMFEVKNTSTIADFAGSKNIGNRKYIKKDKVDELIFIKNNTTSVKELTIQLEVNNKRLFRILDKLNIIYIKPNELPLGNGAFVFNKDIDKIKDYIDTQKQLKNSNNLYDKFQLKVKDIKPNSKIERTLEAFDEFIYERFRDNEGEYVLNALVFVYRNILSTLSKEVMEYTDESLFALLNFMDNKTAKNEFANFLNKCRNEYTTKYKAIFDINLSFDNSKEPYSMDVWKRFGYLLFNKDSDIYKENFKKALENRTYAMVWLYCSLHYVCDWRASDLMSKMPLPNLEVIFNVNEDEFLLLLESEKFDVNMGQSIINYVMKIINTFDLKPNKTKDTNMQIFKFVVENRYVYTIGMLLGLCEVHRRKAEKSNFRYNTVSLITERATRKDVHIDFFGENYIKIFKDEYFCNNRATKTYMIATQVVSQEKGWGDGYYLASVGRGHKLNKHGIGESTQVYLEYINKSNDIDKITYALTERGTFGFIPYQLLKILNGDDFQKVDILEQNNMIKELAPLKATDMEFITKGIYNHRMKATEMVGELLLTEKNNIKHILSKISTGQSPAKMEFAQCLLKAVDRTKCIYPKRTECIGCDYLIPEIYFLLEFNNRILNLLENIKNAKLEYDKKRYSFIFNEVYMPILHEAVSYFGKERVATFIDVVSMRKEIISLVEAKQLSLE